MRPLPPVDFTTLGRLDFAEPDFETFGCLALALEAGRAGGTMPAAMNAANEVAVAAFLAGECGFLDIERTVDAVMGRARRRAARIDRPGRGGRRVGARRAARAALSSS